MKYFLSLISAFLIAAVPAQLSAQNSILILNKSGNTAWQIDTENGEKIAEYETGVGPHEVAVSPDQKKAVITNYGADTAGNSLTVINLEKKAVDQTITLEDYQRPHGIAWFSGGERLIVTAEAQQSVIIVEAASGEILTSIKTGQQVSHMVKLAPHEETAYVTNMGSGSVSILDLKSENVQKTVETGAGTEGVAVVPSTEEIWITNRSANTISILNAYNHKIEDAIESSAFPIRAETSPDGKLVAVSNAKSSEIAIFEAKTHKLVQKVSTVKSGSDGMPIGITFSDDGSRLFAANSNRNEVVVIDTDSWEIETSFQTGPTPDGIAFISEE